MSSAQACGLEVAARTLEACLQVRGAGPRHRQVANTPTGHAKLVRWLQRQAPSVRVCLEATGVYGLDVALTLEATPGIEVMVANPRAARRFAEAMMQRAKTDRIDAEMLCEFAERMPFEPWRPPSEQSLALRSIARRIRALTHQRTGEKNRLHAALASTTTPATVVASLRRQIRSLGREIERLDTQALQLIESDEELRRRYRLLLTAPGIGHKSALQLLGELATLPDGLDPRQWVAHAGLDPRPVESGTSVRKPRRISKNGNRRLRAALYMPALVAVRCSPQIAGFYQQLQQRGLRPIQALVAVMRKLLHAIYGLWTHNQPFDADKLIPRPIKTT